MNLVGLHLRVTSLLESMRQAHDLGMRTFQCFLFQHPKGSYYKLSSEHYREFLTFRRNHFAQLYAHASYWINLASKKAEDNQYILKREIALARSLEFNYVVVHPGSAADWQTKQEGIECVARVLNAILKQEHEVKILLENTAFGGMSIGSDLYELRAIRERLDQPEKVYFCLDTAHAYVWGYDLTQNEGQQKLYRDIEATIGTALKLIHLNDTQELCGSQHDQHVVTGHGNLSQFFKEFVNESRFSTIPLIAEIPEVSLQEQHKIFKFLCQLR